MHQNRALSLVVRLGLAAGIVVGVGILPAWAQEAARAAPLSPFEMDVTRYRSYFDPTGRELSLTDVFPSGVLSRWQLGLAAEAVFTDNVDREPSGRDAFFVNGVGTLSWLRRSQHLQGTLDYRASAPLYQSRAVEDRSAWSHALAGALNWQAARRFTLFGGGGVTQNVESGIETTPNGVRSSYENRFDEYNAHGGYSWQPTGWLTNAGTYRYSFRDYREDDAEGEDARSQAASEDFTFRLSSADSALLGYSFVETGEAVGGVGRQNHLARAEWSHGFRTLGGGEGSAARLSYALDRGLQDEGEDYWNHRATVGYRYRPTLRTELGAAGGMQWIQLEEGETIRAWTWEVDASQRFSADMSLALAASQAWDYAPASSRTSRTVLTRLRVVTGTFRSRLTKTWETSLQGTYRQADQDRRFGEGSGDYWEGEAGAGVFGTWGRSDRLSAEARVVRHKNTPGSDDFLLYSGNIFYERRFTDWLSGHLRYTHERKLPDDIDGSSSGEAGEEYRENRVIGGLALSW